jgi:hypothetical protein
METASKSRHRNALAQETSPYLLQHAGNPVDWHPWGPEALDLARRTGKPILLSVGYSACHWCHVMAHESFEDEDTAALMNDLFVNIKVDREERPDIDKIYQTAQFLLTRRHGGWPLTMFLSHDDHAPFFGGTYFPPDSRYGLPGFKDLLQHVARVYRERQSDIRDQNASLKDALSNMQAAQNQAGPLDAGPLEVARAQIAQSFDGRLGGFSGAPKFPHPTTIECLMRHHAAHPEDTEALHMATFTLRQMALGGIYDQLGGGFARYSVDDQWTIPHFEKMLYDNGPLLALYAQAHQITGDPLFARVARETADWAMREMQAPDGGYYSSLDADSEGHEGKFYVWSRDELRALIGKDDYALFARHFGVDGPANFEGGWHLRVQVPLEEMAEGSGPGVDELRRRIDDARTRLLAERNKRVWPGRDEKILTAWNALMIKGMATAGRLLHRPDCLASAERALDFIRSTLWRDGRLLATCKDGRAHLNAYLDDYAFMIDAVLALLAARWRDGDLDFAIALAEVLLAQFEDADGGGFFFTAHDHEKLLVRSKTLSDEAVPAGCGVAAQVLTRLGHLLGETRYLDAARRTLESGRDTIGRLPAGHLSLLAALEENLEPTSILILRGPRGDALAAWREIAERRYAPTRLTLTIPDNASDLPGVLASREPRQGPAAYLCEGRQCSAPILTLEGLQAALAPPAA